MILGPRSSGKTALLKEVFLASQVSSTNNSSSQDSQANDGSMAEPRTSIPGEADPSLFVSYIDAREQRISQPADLARALQKAASNLKSRMLYAMQLGLFNLAKASFGSLTFSCDPVGKVASGQQDRTPALAEIIENYGELLAKFSQARQDERRGDARMPWPMLCIDEANQLTAWAEGDRNEQRELDALLNFFVRVCAPLLTPICEACQRFNLHFVGSTTQETDKQLVLAGDKAGQAVPRHPRHVRVQFSAVALQE